VADQSLHANLKMLFQAGYKNFDENKNELEGNPELNIE
jgi:hypothetical protein